MAISYCENWFQAGKRPINPLSVADAQARHEARRPYCALSGRSQAEAPTQVLSLAGAWVSVSVLDDLKREYLRYDFNERAPEKLFLKTALFRTFEGSTDEPVEATQFAFSEEGSALIERRNLRDNEVRQRRWNGDMAANWERYPEFGEYAALCQPERDVFTRMA